MAAFRRVQRVVTATSWAHAEEEANREPAAHFLLRREVIMRRTVYVLVFTIAVSCLSYSQGRQVDANGHQWWQHAVFYEVYPRSFADSDNNGIGDLNGITSKLSYLHELGVDAIWISPFFPSPQVDFGYDVSDYESIDPMYGTLADFDRLSQAAKKQKVRLILDFVVNHTSDQHKWFLDSKSSRTSSHHDWYVWRNPTQAGGPPNNWTSTFGGSAWELDPNLKQYYYHYFYKQQPDLNWRNPAVEKAMFDTTRWWYKRGVAGFRLDAVDTMFEDADLRDNPILPGTNAQGDPNENEIYNKKQPEMHEALQRLRKVADEYNAVLIGETWTSNINELKAYYGTDGNELQMPMDFLFTRVDKLSPAEFRKQIAWVDGSGGWPVFVVSNHDIVRSYDRYGDGQHNDEIAKLLAGLYLTLRGTPILYYGEEIGMQTNTPTRKEDVQDPIGRTGWPKEKGRDGQRTPMQWNEGVNAGFSTAKPWLPVPETYRTHNVESESKDPNSILNFYKKVLALRHSNTALLEGDYVAVNESDPNVISYLRRYKDEAVLVAINMSDSSQKASYDLKAQGFSGATAKMLVSTDPGAQELNLKETSFKPFGVYIASVKK